MVTPHYASKCPRKCVSVQVCVGACVWACCLHSIKHTLWTDTDWLLRNSSSRLGSLWGVEGWERGKINRTSLRFILFLFQNKQSGGEADRRAFQKELQRGRVAHFLWSKQFVAKHGKKEKKTCCHGDRRQDMQARVNRWFIESAARFHILPTSF